MDNVNVVVPKSPLSRCYHCGGECSIKTLPCGQFYVKCSKCSIGNLRIDDSGKVAGYDDVDEAVRRWNSRIREIPVPDCKFCEENDGNEECPYFGEPDGCNNRELRCRVLNGEV